MFHNQRIKMARAFHDWGCRAILDTKPLTIKPAPLIFCSMVSERDLIMYLVAIKSVYARIGEGHVHVINDGSLSDASIKLLNHHLGAPTIVNIATIPTAPCPRGGCWERLLHILDLSAGSYVIQLDSDVLARRDLAEVAQCYRDNRSFTLGTWAGRKLTDLQSATDHAAGAESTHIQIVSEQLLTRLDNPDSRLYVRGCAGFAGFAKGAASRADAEAFSLAMQKLVGSRWSDWGTEQVTSNYIVANSPDAHVLSWPRYASYYPNSDVENACLLHFLGSYRYRRALYMRESRKVIAALS